MKLQEVSSSTSTNNAREIALSKTQEFRREFLDLPNVLVQDPMRNCAYYITATQLQEFKFTKNNLLNLLPSTVTFIIPDKDTIDEIPPFLSSSEIAPSVLIQYNRDKTSYFMDFEKLQNFRIEQPTETFDYNCVSFIIPKGLELIEELPSMRRGLLQSNTSM